MMKKKITALLTLMTLLCWLPMAAEAKKKTNAPKNKSKVSIQQSNWRLKVAQQKLFLLGFSKERPSGKMTASTTDALKHFQKKHNRDTLVSICCKSNPYKYRQSYQLKMNPEI